jgi:hypothetical protein
MAGHPGDRHSSDRHSMALHVSTGGHEGGGVHVLAHVQVDETPRHQLLPVPTGLIIARWWPSLGGRWSEWRRYLGHLIVAVLTAGAHKVRAAYAGATIATVVATRDVKP